MTWEEAQEVIDTGDSEDLKLAMKVHRYLVEDSDFRMSGCNVNAKRSQLIAWAEGAPYSADVFDHVWGYLLTPEAKKRLL